MRLIAEIALGYVFGQLLWELLLQGANVAGRASIRMVASVLRGVAQTSAPAETK